MASAKQDDTVRVHYTGKLEDGTVFDSSAGKDPLEFTIGGDQVIPGFEQAIVGMNPGERKTETIPADLAYGPFHNEMVQEIDRSQFPKDIEINAGQHFQVSRTGGAPLVVVVVDVSPEAVTIDANHPLAGKDLVFDIELLEIV